jgi:hypothetical protein
MSVLVPPINGGALRHSIFRRSRDTENTPTAQSVEEEREAVVAPMDKAFAFKLLIDRELVPDEIPVYH